MFSFKQNVMVRNFLVFKIQCAFIITIIIRLQSSRPQVSSSDGGLGPFPTADYHLAGFQDSRKTVNIIGEQGSLSSGFPPPMSRNILMAVCIIMPEIDPNSFGPIKKRTPHNKQFFSNMKSNR